MDILYKGKTSEDLNNPLGSLSAGSFSSLFDENDNNIVVPGGDAYEYGEISITSSTAYSPQTGSLKVYVDRPKFNSNSAGVTQPIPELSVGSTVGFVVCIDHQDRNSDEDSESYVKASFYEDFDGMNLIIGNRAITRVNQDHSQNYLVHAIYNKHVNWAINAEGAWDGPGHIAETIGAGNLNLEHIAVMGGNSYKIRYRQVEKNNLPAGFSLTDAAQVVSTSFADNNNRTQYHEEQGIIPQNQPFAGQHYEDVYLYVYQKRSSSRNGSRMFSFVEAYVYSVI